MKVSYKREMNHNYMIIDSFEHGEDSYESRMLADNIIEGILKFRVRHYEAQKEYYYEITSKQPLSRILEQRSIKGEEVHTLLLGIAAVLKRTEEYLLKEEQILLEPEYIYITPDSFAVYLCLIPGYKSDFPAKVTALLAYLLGKIDHRDKDGVVLVYNLYHESLKENYGMTDLLNHLSERRDAVIEKNIEEVLYDNNDYLENQKKDFVNNEFYTEDLSDGGKEEVKKPVVSGRTRKKRPILQILAIFAACEVIIWLLYGWSAIFSYGLLPAAGAVILIITVSFKGKQIQNDKLLEEKKPYALKEKSVKDWTDEDESDNMVEYSSFWLSKEPETILLKNPEEASSGAVLESLVPNGESIKLSYLPFVIGKHKEMADYCLLQPTVSRLHLRVDKKEGVYIVTDLNSTNGTIVEGYQLQANETVSVKNGDVIYLADVGYRFVQTGIDKM